MHATDDASSDQWPGSQRLDFWQREAHYYEERARVQGASATQMITVSMAALLAGTIPLAIQGWSLTKGGIAVSYLLLAVPLAALMFWMTSLRLLSEMYRLVAYYEYADRFVSESYLRLAPLERPYVRWDEVAGERQVRSGGNIAWILAAIPIPVGGSIYYIYLFFAREGDSIAKGDWTRLWAFFGIVAVAAIVVMLIEVAQAKNSTATAMEAIDSKPSDSDSVASISFESADSLAGHSATETPEFDAPLPTADI